MVALGIVASRNCRVRNCRVQEWLCQELLRLGMVVLGMVASRNGRVRKCHVQEWSFQEWSCWEWSFQDWSFQDWYKYPPQCINHKGILSPWWILHQQVYFVNQFRSTPSGEYIRESPILISEYTRESITNTNNSSNIKKKLQILSRHVLRDQESKNISWNCRFQT